MEQPTKSVRVSAGTRIYYFDVYKDSNGEPYLSIAEVPISRNPGNKKRQRIFIHPEDMEKFGAAFSEIADHIKQEKQS